MAVPWQSDFLDCSVESGDAGDDLVWWPTQRPIHVRATAQSAPLSWARSFEQPGQDMSLDEMIRLGDRLGLILASGDAFLETARADLVRRR